jgi:stalled ribosome rescue protein Dom34
MNERQKKFFDFILERVQKGKEDEAKVLLEEGFSKQASGTFTAEYSQEIIPKYIAILKPEYVEEVKNIMVNFGPKKAGN